MFRAKNLSLASLFLGIASVAAADSLQNINPVLKLFSHVESALTSLNPRPVPCPSTLPTSEFSQLTKTQKLTIEQITSIFENSTPAFVYEYIEDIDDGAGITTGRVGFNTNEGDLLDIVKKYLALKPKEPVQPLAAYVPCLEKVKGSAQYDCLYSDVDPNVRATPQWKSEGLKNSGFGLAWVQAAKDPIMQKVQDDHVEKTFFTPAVEWTKKLGLRSPLSCAIIYDTLIQMDTLPQMATLTQNQFATTHSGRTIPQTPEEERDWLRLYQVVRKADLSKTPVGASTTSRVDALGQLLDSGNMSLNLPLSFTYAGEHFQLGK
jgi:chitosanase